MTNEELLEQNPSSQFLTGVEQQRIHLLKLDLFKQPCPNCATKQNVFEAAGIEINDYDFGKTKLKYECIGCKRELDYSVPFVSLAGPGWEWRLIPIKLESN